MSRSSARNRPDADDKANLSIAQTAAELALDVLRTEELVRRIMTEAENSVRTLCSRLATP